MHFHVLLSTVRDGVLNSRARKRLIVMDLGVLVLVSSALGQLIDDIGFFSILDASNSSRCCPTSGICEWTEWTGHSSVSATLPRCTFSELGVGIGCGKR